MKLVQRLQYERTDNTYGCPTLQYTTRIALRVGDKANDLTFTWIGQQLSISNQWLWKVEF